jgi:hypothetical protein
MRILCILTIETNVRSGNSAPSSHCILLQKGLLMLFPVLPSSPIDFIESIGMVDGLVVMRSSTIRWCIHVRSLQLCRHFGLIIVRNRPVTATQQPKFYIGSRCRCSLSLCSDKGACCTYHQSLESVQQPTISRSTIQGVQQDCIETQAH